MFISIARQASPTLAFQQELLNVCKNYQMKNKQDIQNQSYIYRCLAKSRGQSFGSRPGNSSG